ncbi:MAG: hypothetical protein M1379_00920 [Firmicutes bacterium]|nr:hypothetical protein [Bacillota bacterium]
MAESKKTEAKETPTTSGAPPGEPLDPTIEDLAEKNKIEAWVLAGVKVEYNWGAGKRLPEQEFLKKVDRWLKGPMCQR